MNDDELRAALDRVWELAAPIDPDRIVWCEPLRQFSVMSRGVLRELPEAYKSFGDSVRRATTAAVYFAQVVRKCKRRRYQRGSVRKPWSEQTWLARIKRAIRRHDRNALAALMAEGDGTRPEHGRRELYQSQARRILSGEMKMQLRPMLRAHGDD